MKTSRELAVSANIKEEIVDQFQNFFASLPGLSTVYILDGDHWMALLGTIRLEVNPEILLLFYDSSFAVDDSPDAIIFMVDGYRGLEWVRLLKPGSRFIIYTHSGLYQFVREKNLT